MEPAKRRIGATRIDSLFHCVIALLCIGGGAEARGAESGRSVAVAASAETHGMLRACDCRPEPGGGFAARAALIDSIRAERPVLVLDAGGFAAGGMYDADTEGRERDSVRTRAALHAMGMIGYDAVAIGDEELRYDLRDFVRTAAESGVPLISANVTFRDSTRAAAPFRVVERGGVRFGITAVSAPERLLSRDPSAAVSDPIAAIEAIWDSLGRISDARIILSHCGERFARVLARRFPESALIVNGHRKNSVEPAFTEGGVTVMQFGFQGKRLSYAEVTMRDSGAGAARYRWLRVAEHAPRDSAVLSAIARIEQEASARARTVLDVYIMAQCPYGLSAVESLLPIFERFDAAEPAIRFIGDVGEGGRLESLRGPDEVREELVWLAVNALYPEYWPGFLYLRTAQKMPADSVAAVMGLDTARLGVWMRTRGEAVLAGHYRRSNRLNIHASPTLFWNNAPAPVDIDAMRIADRLCAARGAENPWCDSLPACFDDADCRKPGMIGTCEPGPPAACVYREAARFDFIAVVPDTLEQWGQAEALGTTRDLFPGARLTTLTASSARGRRLIEQAGARALPLYLFDTTVAAAAHFEAVESGLIRRGAWYTFKPGVMKARAFVRRAKKPGMVALYIDPLFPNLSRVIQTALARDSSLTHIHIVPSFGQRQSPPDSVANRHRRDEARLWLALRRTDPGAFARYMRARADSAVSVDSLRDSLYARYLSKPSMSRESKMLASRRAELRALRISGPVEALVDNWKVYPVAGPAALADVLDRALRDPGARGQ
jgi:hypothetical protein